jgi:hypothetical protein
MHSFSLDVVASSSTYSKLRRRCNVARNASKMTKEISDKCSACATTIVTKSQQTPFRLPFEAKIVMSLVFLAIFISLYRTSILLRHFDANYGARSLQADQSSTTKLRVRLQYTGPTNPRVVQWDENVDWILTPQYSSTRHHSMTKVFRPVDVENKDNNDDDEDLRVDPTRQYDQNDSADLPTMERTNWPDHDFDPHCLPAASWQTTFHPNCNEVHAGADFKQALVEGEFTLLSRKGYWRYAWLHHKDYFRNEMSHLSIASNKAVWKTLK